MNPKSKVPTQKKLPKARIMYVAPSTTELTGSTYRPLLSAEEPSSVIVGVFTPFPTKKSAKARLKWEKLDEEEKVDAIAKAMWHAGNPANSWFTFGKPWQERHRQSARSILALFSNGRTK